MFADALGAWIRTRQKWMLALAAALQVGVLSAMTGITTVRHWNAEIVYLRAEPVDPRDFFRGEWVRLGYPFGRFFRVQGEEIDIPSDYSGPVFVPLIQAKDSKLSEGGKLTASRPENGLYLRGTMNRGMLRFGIEQYYVQEGQGLRLEQAARDRKLIVKVSVPRGGQGMVVGAEIE